MRINFVGLAILEIDAPAIGLDAGNARAQVLVHVLDTFVITLTIIILFRVRIGIAQAPELGDELFAFFIVLQLSPGVALGLSNYRIDVVYPNLKGPVGDRVDLPRLVLWVSAGRFLLGQRGRNNYQQRQEH